MDILIVTLASLLAFIGNLPYLRGVLGGKVKPHPYTWLVSSIVSCIVVFGMFTKGAGIGTIPIAISEFFTIIIFLFSIKFGWKKITSLDMFFLLAALLAVVPWLYTKDPTISVILAVTIDLISLAPSLRKTYHNPETENPILYGSNVLRHILALFIMQTYNITTTLHSLVMIASNTIFVLTIIYCRKKGIMSKIQ